MSLRQPVLAPSRAAPSLVLVLACLAAWSCAKPGPLKVGVVFSFTGSNASIAGEVRSGMEMALEDAAAGSEARPIELLFRDDAADPAKAAAAVAELAKEGCALVVGPLTSGLAPAVVEAARAAGLAALSPTVSTSSLAAKDDGFFRLYPTTRELARAVGARAAASGAARPVLIADSTNAAYAAEWAEEFEAAVRAAGGQGFAARLEYAGGPGLAPAELVGKALAARPDSVLLVSSSTHAALLLEALSRAGFRGRRYSSTWAITSFEQFVELAGASAEGLESALLFDPDSADPNWTAFADRATARNGVRPSPSVALGVETVRAILAARAAGGAKREELLAALPGLSFGGLQGEVRFDAFGDVIRPARSFAIRDGRASFGPEAAK